MTKEMTTESEGNPRRMTYGELPIGTEVEIRFAGIVSGTPIYSVTIGATTYEVKGNPFTSPVLLGRWSPFDTAGRYMRRGLFWRIA